MADTKDTKLKIKAKDVDKIVCDWSMGCLVPMSEEALNALVDALCAALDIDVKEGLI